MADKINTDIKTLKKFGVTMAAAFLVVAGIALQGNKHNVIFAAAVSLGFFIAAYLRPVILKPVYIPWMKFAFVLSWVNTRLILIAVFYLIVTPVAIVLKLSGVDLLGRRIEKTKQTYWLPKEKNSPAVADYNRQF